MLQPLHDRVLVEVLQWNETTAGGIELPAYRGDEESQHGSLRGRVLALGPGRQGTSDDGSTHYFAPICPRPGNPSEHGLKVGDEVTFGAYAGCPRRVGGKECRLVAAHDIFAVESPE